MSIIKSLALLLLSITAASAQIVPAANSSSKETLTAEFKAEYNEHKKLAAEEEWGASLIHARKAYELGKQLFIANDKNNAMLAYNYGYNLYKVMQYAEAIQLLSKAVEIYEIALGNESPELIELLIDLGRLHRESGKGNGLNYFKRSLKISERHYGKDTIEHGKLLVTIGIELMHNLISRMSQEYLMEGYEILKRLEGENHPDTAYAAFNLGKYELGRNKPANAVENFKMALASFTDTDKPTSQLELMTHGFLVSAYEQLGQRELATEHCIAIGKMTPATPNQDVQPIYRTSASYPTKELRAYNSGYAVIEFDIDENGFVINPRSLESSSINFEKAAIKTVEEWRYAPAFIDGKPAVREDMQTRITFEVE